MQLEQQQAEEILAAQRVIDRDGEPEKLAIVTAGGICIWGRLDRLRPHTRRQGIWSLQPISKAA